MYNPSATLPAAPEAQETATQSARLPSPPGQPVERPSQRVLLQLETQWKHLEISGVCAGAQADSGDFYDFFELSLRRLALAIGDVSGKGRSAAPVAKKIQGSLRAELSSSPPAESGSRLGSYLGNQVVPHLNARLHAHTGPAMFATMFVAVYEEREGLLVFTNAGHLAPLLIRSRNIIRLEPTATVIGAFPSATYGSSAVRLEPNDLLVTFTDGLTEAKNAAGLEFGEERLVESLMQISSRSPGSIARSMIDATEEWSGSLEPDDDTTMLVVKHR